MSIHLNEGGVSNGVYGRGVRRHRESNAEAGGEIGRHQRQAGAVGRGVYTAREPCSRWARLNFILSEDAIRIPSRGLAQRNVYFNFIFQ